ncbi:TonB-dependent receptor plug domain-containing protein [bacterium]|nr:TonB-dependent receptor plug domain-containing protein [bacterium]
MRARRDTAARLGLILGLLLAAGGTAMAAGLAGRVTDAETGLPLAGVEVTLSGATPRPAGVPDLRRTDSAGRFAWPDLPPAAWTFAAATPGYETVTLAVDLPPEGLADLVIALPLQAFELEGLVVVGGTADIEGDLQTGYVNLDRQTLSEVPGIIEDDPVRALQFLPGVQSASDISSGLYIRGGGPDQTLILMDGVTVYNPTHAFGFFSTFNNDAVADVSLYKGAYPAEYGGRLGAVVDVDMVEDTSPETSGRVGLSLISGRLFLQGRAGPDQWYLAGRRSFLEPLLKAIDTPEDPIPSWYFYDANAGYTTTRGGGVTHLGFYHGRDQVDVQADVDTGIDLGWGNTVALLRHERFLTDDLEGRVTLSHSRYGSDTDAEILATTFRIDNRVEDTTLAARLDWRASDAHRLVGGLGHSWYDFRYRQVFAEETGIDYRSRPGELAAFAEDRWFVDDRSTVRTGLRYRRLSDGDRQLWEPRFSASRQVRDDLRLKLGGGLYHQQLQLVSTEGFSSGDFYVPIDETAAPGRSLQVVLGADWDADPRTRVSLEAYNTDLDELVVLDNNVPVDQNSFAADDLFVTGGKGYARGVELFVRHARENWTGWVGYTLGWTERNFAEINGGADFVPKYDRRHDLNLLLTRQTGSWKISAAFRYATGQAFTPAAARYQIQDPATGEVEDTGQILSGARNSGRLLPYHRLDLSARRPIRLFGLDGEFVAQVFNVYNRRNEWFVQYDTENDVTEATVVKMLPLIPSVGVNLDF